MPCMHDLSHTLRVNSVNGGRGGGRGRKREGGREREREMCVEYLHVLHCCTLLPDLNKK